MKNTNCLALSILLLSLVLTAKAQAGEATATGPQTLHHVVIIWLKQHGDEQIRQQYIKESQVLAQLPGVLSYQIGTPASIQRQRPNAAVDDSYDLAVSSRFESQQAYEDFLKHPLYLKLAQESLRPLVDQYKIYDFAVGAAE